MMGRKARPFMVATSLVFLLALAFDFINGFHDAANSIATVVSTRVLSPRVAVMWAAFFNFVAIGTAVSIADEKISDDTLAVLLDKKGVAKNTAAFDVKLTAEEISRINEFFPVDAASGPRYPEHMMSAVNR